MESQNEKLLRVLLSLDWPPLDLKALSDVQPIDERIGKKYMEVVEHSFEE